MKRVRFKFLLGSSVLGLILALSNHTAMAQKIDIDSAVPMPDTTFPSPPTVKELATPTRVEPLTPAKPAEASAAPLAATNAALPAQPATQVVAPASTNQQTVTTPAAQPAMSAQPASNLIADKLREIMTGNALERAIIRKADRESVQAFYKARDYAPIWADKGGANARAKSAIAYLGRASEVGLDPADYPTPDFKSDVGPEALAEAEIKLTNSALTFAHHAQIGRIHFSRVSADMSFDLVAPEPAQILTQLAASEDADKVLDSYNPPHAEFKALRTKLAELRNKPEEITQKQPALLVRVEEGKTLRPGMKDPRVIALRQRLDVPGDKSNPRFDGKVKDAVMAFQLAENLDVNGIVGPSTIRALNGEGHSAKPSGGSVIDTVIVNMERWRWYPRNLENPHVVVNVPDYTLTLWNNNDVYWKTKIVAGKPGKETPLISARMTHITVNPTWNVPPSIIEKEYLPALERDPDALDRIGLKVIQDPDGTVHISQPPGARNALGRIRFNFPNKFLVYQHDTPDKNLFDREKRAYSHGCMRVQYPLTYGEKLLSLAMPEALYTEAKLQRMFGSSEINLNFVKPIWVHLTYQTAFVDQDGKLQIRDDVYRHDARMLTILKGNERKIADIAIERRSDPSSRPVRLPPGAIAGYGGGGSEGNFLDWLFGGGQVRSRSFDGPRYFNGPRIINGRYSAR